MNIFLLFIYSDKMRFREILELLDDLLNEISYKNCFGCRNRLENNLEHQCLINNKWDYFEQGLRILLFKEFITEEEYVYCSSLDSDE
jgi:hypothetical protein